MILDEIVLHDFGIYGGRQSVRLTPQPRRPVILFGGLNGRGKTTLLDAFQLCLYGSAAQLSNRNGQSYEEYLRKSIHHAAGRSGASIELSFRNRVNGAEQSFRLIRSWVATKSSVREHFEVVRDGKFDRLATDHWASQVEDFIPSRIAHLFLFDGEKVEGYADLEAAPTLIATAIQNLLGLDIVERLTTDLISLERRHRGAVRPPEEQKQLEQLREDIRIVNAAKASIVQARAAAGNALDRVRRKAEDLEEQYRREGGTLYEERAAKEASLASVERDLERVRRELREVVTGSAPLLLVPTLLKTLQKRDADEEVGRAASESLRTLLEEHEALLAHPVVAQLPRAKRDALSQAMADRRQARNLKLASRLSLSWKLVREQICMR